MVVLFLLKNKQNTTKTCTGNYTGFILLQFPYFAGHPLYAEHMNCPRITTVVHLTWKEFFNMQYPPFTSAASLRFAFFLTLKSKK